MENDAAQPFLPALVIAIIVLIIGWFFIFPVVCRSFPIRVPGLGIDFCIFFR
ncbi:hypothetical protein [Methanoregula sp. PtaB.Bin085]|uniref:hypothetical protein n=1 Tax=Methanoregula sp. PtaB.Bin085 TaxID=1811680 RepID=UPI0009CE8463|nr:hypothetical protein [Methanoregula sp. PtaB.Bin085]OPX63455.1 MAG: hypothetical protein A4E33_01644 [Methanoregula sp. PtaB.Bin085]